MAFADVVGTSAGVQGTNSSSWTLTYPTGIVDGEGLLLLIAMDGAQDTTFPAGWSVVAEGVHPSFDNRFRVVGKDADGTETGDFTVTLGGAEQGAWRIFRIAGADAVATWVAIPHPDYPSGSSTQPNPPSLTPAGGAKDFLWIAVYGADNGTNAATTAYPTSYTDDQFTGSGGTTAGAGYGVATRSLNAATEDPGVFTMAGSDTWAAQTIAIPPAAEAPAAGQLVSWMQDDF